MAWGIVSQIAGDLLALALVVRLSFLGLHSVYRVFCLFLLIEVLGTSLTLIQTFTGPFMDYRIFWMITRVVTWVFYLWMVYALLSAILVKLPGILRLSRQILNITFSVAIVAALLTARPEYLFSGQCAGCSSVKTALSIAFVLERVISLASLLAIVAILGFILAFPVNLPRNLVFFTAGYLVYFTSKTGILLAHDLWAQGRIILSVISVGLMDVCFVYWLLTLNESGERSPITIGKLWNRRSDLGALHQLEAMNLALLRASRR